MLLRHPVVVATGMISAAGFGVLKAWELIRSQTSGLGPLTLFSAPRYADHRVGEVRENVDALAAKVRGSRSDKLAWIAASETLSGVELQGCLKSISPSRIGVVFGSTVGGMLGSEDALRHLLRDQKRNFGAFRYHEPGNAAELCARRLNAQGPCMTFATACAAGATAIAVAADLIEQGEADLVLAGGADSLSRLTLYGFGSLLLLAPNGCRPFDAQRAGISLGEGAATLMLAAEETALAYNLPILARLSGWGASCDAYHATAPQPDGLGAKAAIEAALQRAELNPSQIDYISSHGTGTPDNDLMESKALKSVFGETVPPFSSIKRFFGHTLAASGAIKAGICIKAIREQAIPPSLGFESTDPKIGFEPTRTYREAKLNHVLSNSFGFGGNNVALVFSAPQESKQQHESRASVQLQSNVSQRNRLAIIGAGIISPAGNSIEEVFETVRNGTCHPSLVACDAPTFSGQVPAYVCNPSGLDQLIEPGKRRKLSRLQQMVIAATQRSLSAGAMAQMRSQPACVAIGTSLGSLNDTATFVENIILERPPRPLFFSNSVHNSLASQIAIEFGTSGLNSTAIQRGTSFETALWHAHTELAGGRSRLGLVGAADELSKYMLAAGMQWRWWNSESQQIVPFSNRLQSTERALPGEGVAMFALSSAAADAMAWVTAIQTGSFTPTVSSQVLVDPSEQARWILEGLCRNGVLPEQVDFILTGANGWPRLDAAYLAVATELSRLVGRNIPAGAYKQYCGEHGSASAFGFLAAIGLVRGELSPRSFAPEASETRCRCVLLYTLSPHGTKAMSCICA